MLRSVVRRSWQAPRVERGAARISDDFGPDRLASRLGDLVSVKRSRSNLFCYVEKGRGEIVGADRFQFELVHMAPSELMAAVRTESDYFYYMTAPVSGSGEKMIESIFANKGHPPSIWIGGNRSTTQAHYDIADNVLVQAYGLKRVRIWSPCAHWSMRVFPDAHPLARKAQIDIDATSLNETPLIDVILAPGDLIRIPAFWFHHCEAYDGASISLNQFQSSETAYAASGLLKLPPVHDEAFLLALLPDQDFLAQVYTSRYELLAAYYDLKNNQPPTFLASDDDTMRQKQLRAYQSRIQLHLAKLQKAAGPLGADGVTQIALAHLVELWAMHWFDHSAAKVCNFLSTFASSAES